MNLQDKISPPRDDSLPNDERKEKLRLEYQQNIQNNNSPYKDVVILTFGEVLWIIQNQGWSGGVESSADKERPNFSEANFVGVNLSGIDLREANLRKANLSGTILNNAYLSGADFSDALLIKADLKYATLYKANLRDATLLEADLSNASLILANFNNASLAQANLSGASLIEADLSGANFKRVIFDDKTNLSDIKLFNKHYGGIKIEGIQWNNVDLSVVNWGSLSQLGDDSIKLFSNDLGALRASVRAYRQLAVHLRQQGLNEEADRFAYLAQVRQRGVFLRSIKLTQYFFSHLLNLVAGYGYRSERALFWYLATVIGFSIIYTHVGYLAGHPFTFHEALIFSLTSFHGRGFFPGGLSLDDPITSFAATEAVVGLFIEISFIATFTQRFFAK